MSQATSRALAAGKKSVISNVVRTKNIEVVDSSGKVRISITEDGLHLNDAEGNHRGSFATVLGNPILDFVDSAGNPRAGLTDHSLMLCDSRLNCTILLTESGVFLNNAGRARGMFGIIDGEPSLTLCDSGSVHRGVFQIKDGEAVLNLNDCSGKAKAVFSVKNGCGSIGLSNSVDKRVWSSPCIGS